MKKLLRYDHYLGVQTDKTYTIHDRTEQYEHQSYETWKANVLKDCAELCDAQIADAEYEEGNDDSTD